MTDFEQAAISALTEIGVKVTGCHYHFLNALQRKAKSLGIKKTKDNQRIIHLASNLALLPTDKISEGWDYVVSEIKQDIPAMTNFQNYFQTVWLTSCFKDIISVFGRQNRTNNSAEGWHHNLNSYISRNKPTFLQILNFLFQESHITTFRSNKLKKFNNSSQAKRAQHIDSDDRIIDAQMQLTLGEISVGHFLEKLR